MKLNQKIALVTGASRGIGKAIALHLGKQGATVVGTATSSAGAEAINQMLQAEGIQGIGLVYAQDKHAETPAFYENLKKTIGAPNILVNNAGITRDNLLLRMKDEEWQAVIDTNLTGVFALTRLVVKDMLRAREGRIINVSSVVGTTGAPGQANYAAAKAGLIGFTKALALELASRQITANVVSPGYIDTDMTQALAEEYRAKIVAGIPLQRCGSADDIAYCVGFLAAPEANYITGQTIHVNGGMFMN